MRTFIVPLTLSLALGACNRVDQSQTPPQPPPVFDVRDFKIDKVNEDGAVLIKGRGTLVTRDPRLLSGTFMVWISVKKVHRNDREQRYSVVLKDGVGNIETLDRMDEFNALTATTRFNDWRVLGYIPLQPAELAAQPSAASAPK